MSYVALRGSKVLSFWEEESRGPERPGLFPGAVALDSSLFRICFTPPHPPLHGVLDSGQLDLRGLWVLK